MAKTKKHIIFTTDYKESYEEWLEMNEYTPDDRSLEEYIQDSIGVWAEDEYASLKKDCGNIICIADLGLWDGRHSGYKLNRKGTLNAIFDMINTDDYEVYIEGNDIKATVHHHDGTNYLTFREVRKGRNIQKLCDTLYEGEEVTSQMISIYTRPLGKVVKEILVGNINNNGRLKYISHIIKTLRFMANWYGNASPDVRRAINQAFYGSDRTATTTRRYEVSRSDKYIYYSDGSKERW